MLFDPESAIPPEAWLVILDEIDVGVIVCDPALGRIRLANREAIAALASFGAGDELAPAFREALGARTAAELPADRFSRAAEAPAPSGARFFVRGRRLGPPLGGAVLVVTMARLRQETVIELLHRRLGLSRRQAQVVALIRDGLSSAEIATALGLTQGTVRQYLSAIYLIVGVTGRAQLLSRVEERIAVDARSTGDPVKVK
ncbi:MAG TPA: helix-turn-helix transcriptional regulator [Kofleriaceae bacterium]|nr:helix-turn-helix transcriptional regulator [Kofleriaceae bacterium]